MDAAAAAMAVDMPKCDDISDTFEHIKETAYKQH
jgi:hypothetical protein